MKKLLALIFVLVLLAAGGAQAQDDLGFDSLEVDLWPEYDRPTMLVIYHINLSTQASLPADLTIRIPAAAGEPHAVASRQPDGRLINLAYEQRVSDEWLSLSMKATTHEVQIEFYDPGLVKDGAARSFEYQWPGDYAVESLVIRVQQPVGATDMRISPDMGSGRAGADELTYYTYNTGSLPAGQPFKISINYQKATDELSSSALSLQPSAPIENAASGRPITLQTALPWVLGFLGLALIIVGALWYWQSGRQKARPERRPRRRSASQPAAPGEAVPAAGEHIYCHECGKRASPNDRFCRACGTPLRTG